MSKKVLRFTASWCAPCKAMASVLETIENKPEVEVIDIDENKDLALKYLVRSVPTLVMVDGDKEIARFSGVRAKDLIEEWFKQ